MGSKQSQPAAGTGGSAGAAGGGSSGAAASQPSWYAQAQAGYAQVVDAIIRPPRASYAVGDLGAFRGCGGRGWRTFFATHGTGPAAFEFFGKPFTRTDCELQNERGLTLQCSHWQRGDLTEPAPCVVVMHGNSSCRLCALEVLDCLLAEGCSVFAFDFAGSGMSGGEYVSLGFFEKDDLSAVVAHLREQDAVSTIGLWGRSMGAATALLHAHRDHSIAAMVLDSPFTSLKELAMELVQRGKAASGYSSVPDFLVSMVLGWVTSSVKKKAGFDIGALTPIADVDKSFVPVLFVAGQQDDFIAPHHTQKIHDKYAGDKNLSLVVGGHNSPRPSWWMDSAAIFVRTYMQVPPALALGSAAPSTAAAQGAGGSPWFPAGPAAGGARDSIRAAWARVGGSGARQGGAYATASIADAEAAMMQQALAMSALVGGGAAPAPAPAPVGAVHSTGAGKDDSETAADAMGSEGGAGAPTHAAAAPPTVPATATLPPAVPVEDSSSSLAAQQAALGGLDEEALMAMAVQQSLAAASNPGAQ